jgi:lipid-binding SYLF domain-containing protein
MVVMNDKGMQNLLSSKFKLGADASVAAGPVGRHADASTDWKMRAEVLTYSRARGIFAGISLNGAAINQNQEDTRAFYGRMVPFKTILTGNVASPAGSGPWVEALRKHSGNGVNAKK